MLDAHVRELLDLVGRWIHLIAGIMWIGNSMLFNWLDRNLVKPQDARTGYDGELWMVHSGGFYQVEKMQLEPSQMPQVLHWFKWQAYTTWISGFFLLIVVYYLGGGAYLVDPAVSSLTATQATAVGLGLLVVAWAVYDGIWRSPLSRYPKSTAALCYALVLGVAYALTHLLSGRAAYMHVGAMLGTLMAGNVFMVIMPSQRALIRETQSGQPQDVALAKRAKQRSIHNNYMTFPVLFVMVSNHFAGTYGHPLNWVILGVLILAGAGVRHILNIRFVFPAWKPALGATIAAAIGLLYVLTLPPSAPAGASVAGDRVPFAAAHAVIEQRCVACHSTHPTDPTFTSAPHGVTFDSPEQIQAMRDLIKTRAVVTTAMPLGNKTGMTAAERALLGRWIDEGAPLN
jgi:uncharacterized membrane protein